MNEDTPMPKRLTSPFACIEDDATIFLYDKRYPTNGLRVNLSNVEMIFEGNKMTLAGDKDVWEITFDKKFVEDLEEAPAEAHTKMGYKTIFDFLRRKKKPYVNGWYRLARTEKYKCVTTNYFLVM